jgi:hypothetical protein
MVTYLCLLVLVLAVGKSGLSRKVAPYQQLTFLLTPGQSSIRDDIPLAPRLRSLSDYRLQLRAELQTLCLVFIVK